MEEVLGIVGIEGKGEYNAALSYEKNNIVRSGNAIYMALQEVPAGLSPLSAASTDYWMLLLTAPQSESEIHAIGETIISESNPALTYGGTWRELENSEKPYTEIYTYLPFKRAQWFNGFNGEGSPDLPIIYNYKIDPDSVSTFGNQENSDYPPYTFSLNADEIAQGLEIIGLNRIDLSGAGAAFTTIQAWNEQYNTAKTSVLIQFDIANSTTDKVVGYANGEYLTMVLQTRFLLGKRDSRKYWTRTA